MSESKQQCLDLSGIILDDTEAFVVPGETHVIDIVHPDTGRTAINGNTLEEVRLRYPTAIKVNLESWATEMRKEYNPPITWNPSTEEKFDEALNCLPPHRFLPHAFLMGEPVDHLGLSGFGRFDCYQCLNGKYLVSSRPITVGEFNLHFHE